MMFMRPQPPHVWIAHPFHPVLSGPGGGVSYILWLAKELSRAGFPVTLLGAGPPQEEPGIDGVNFVSVSRVPPSGSWSWIPYLFGLAVFALKNRNTRNTLIHLQRTYFALPFILLRVGAAMVCTIHGGPTDFLSIRTSRRGLKLIGKLRQLVDDYCLSRTQSIIAVSQSIARHYRTTIPHLAPAIQVIPPAADASQFHPMDKTAARTQLGFPTDSKLITYVGRLAKEKNLPLLLRAYRLVLRDSDASWHLILVGDGEERGDILRLVDEMGLPNVVWVPPMPHESIPLVLNAADVLVLPSDYEGAPTIVREAVACGVPIVSTRVGDVTEIQKCYPRLEVSDPNAAAFAESIVRVTERSNANEEHAFPDPISREDDLFDAILRAYDTCLTGHAQLELSEGSAIRLTARESGRRVPNRPGD
jgi:glycosyltransferase involved in cell wall biosynthesis